jgi:hypothetical protein
MARILEIREVCERALRKIGTFSIRDSQADAAEVEEARFWLDMIMGHLAARKRTWWLAQETAPITLIAGQADYPMAAVLPAGDPMAFPILVTRVTLDDGRRDPDITIARRREWEAREAAVTTGPVRMVYIDRSTSPVLRVWPTPSEPVFDRLDLVFQRVSPDLTRSAPTERVTKFREAWNLYIVTALAAEIGDGPVRKLPADEVRALKTDRDRLLFDLEAYDDHEQAGEPRRTAFHDF